MKWRKGGIVKDGGLAIIPMGSCILKKLYDKLKRDMKILGKDGINIKLPKLFPLTPNDALSEQEFERMVKMIFREKKGES